jgi:rhodanese-related sulfurtransferase
VVPEIDLPAFAAAQADGAFVLDVREPFEYVAGHVPGAVLLPMAYVRAQLGELPKGGRIYVICASGNRSLTAAGWLRAAGIDAVSVAGGTGGWTSQGRPVVRGRHADQSVA